MATVVQCFHRCVMLAPRPPMCFLVSQTIDGDSDACNTWWAAMRRISTMRGVRAEVPFRMPRGAPPLRRGQLVGDTPWIDCWRTSMRACCQPILGTHTHTPLWLPFRQPWCTIFFARHTPSKTRLRELIPLGLPKQEIVRWVFASDVTMHAQVTVVIVRGLLAASGQMQSMSTTNRRIDPGNASATVFDRVVDRSNMTDRTSVLLSRGVAQPSVWKLLAFRDESRP